MSNEIINSLTNKFGDKILESSLDDYFRIHIKVDVDSISEVAEFVYKKLDFVHSNFCMGTDLGETIEVSWYVGNPKMKEILVLKANLNRETPEVDSLIHLWSGMDWHERETFGMLGIVFKGHGDLRRLILPDIWEGFPLRNDYEYIKPSYRKPEDELVN